jgi:hypothetical protein
MHCSQIYFDKELYTFQTDLLSIMRSLNTVCTTTGIYHASYVDCNFARGFVWVWNLVADIEGGTQAEGVWE